MTGADNELIAHMVEQVTKLCDPYMVFLVSKKNNTRGELTSFKLCIVISDEISPEQTERKLLLNTDCPVPCDFIVYNLEDWDEYATDDCSFAYRVENGGERLYVKG